jgi:hypothetical protein
MIGFVNYPRFALTVVTAFRANRSAFIPPIRDLWCVRPSEHSSIPLFLPPRLSPRPPNPPRFASSKNPPGAKPAPKPTKSPSSQLFKPWPLVFLGGEKSSPIFLRVPQRPSRLCGKSKSHQKSPIKIQHSSIPLFLPPRLPPRPPNTPRFASSKDLTQASCRSIRKKNRESDESSESF